MLGTIYLVKLILKPKYNLNEIYHQFYSFNNIQDLQLMENNKYIPSHFSQEYHITCEILLALSVKHVRISDKDGANKIGINIK